MDMHIVKNKSEFSKESIAPSSYGNRILTAVDVIKTDNH